MRAVRFYFTVDDKATAGIIGGLKHVERCGSICGRFQIVSAIMPRFKIYGRAKPFETYRHLFIVTENHLLQPVRSLSSLSFFLCRVLSSWPSSSPARGSAFNARCRRRPPAVLKWYGNAAADKHQMQFRASTETQLRRTGTKADLHARNYVASFLQSKLSHAIIILVFS